MKNTQSDINQDKNQTSQLPKLQLLKLKQLEGLTGGAVDKGTGTVECPACVRQN